MKLLFLSDDLLQGGAERQFCLLASGLKNRGHEVRILLFYDSPVFYRDILENAGINTEHIGCRGNMRRRITGIRDAIVSWHPDAVVSFKESANIAACITGYFIKFPLVVSERNITVRLDLRQQLKFFLYRKSAAIVSNNHSQAKYIRDKFPKLSGRLHVITNALSDDFMSEPVKNSFSGTPVVLTLARISAQKNLPAYIEAVAKVVSGGVKARFLWYGRSESDDIRKEAMELIRKYSLQDVFELHEESKDTLALYDRATHFILPSLHEGFSNVLCEAMSRGLVAAASDVADNAFILNDSRRLFNPHDTDEMASAITETLSLSEEEYKRESQRNIKRARELCRKETLLDAYGLLFSTLEST